MVYTQLYTIKFDFKAHISVHFFFYLFNFLRYQKSDVFVNRWIKLQAENHFSKLLPEDPILEKSLQYLFLSVAHNQLSKGLLLFY